MTPESRNEPTQAVMDRMHAILHKCQDYDALIERMDAKSDYYSALPDDKMLDALEDIVNRVNAQCAGG